MDHPLERETVSSRASALALLPAKSASSRSATSRCIDDSYMGAKSEEGSRTAGTRSVLSNDLADHAADKSSGSGVEDVLVGGDGEELIRSKEGGDVD